MKCRSKPRPLTNDPSSQATVIVCIVLCRMMITAMFFQPAMLEEYEKSSVGRQVLTKIISGLFSALATVPSTVFLDRMFMRAQKVTNSQVGAHGT